MLAMLTKPIEQASEKYKEIKFVKESHSLVRKTFIFLNQNPEVGNQQKKRSNAINYTMLKKNKKI